MPPPAPAPLPTTQGGLGAPSSTQGRAEGTLANSHFQAEGLIAEEQRLFLKGAFGGKQAQLLHTAELWLKEKK